MTGRPVKYPKQVVCRVTDEMMEWLRADAEKHGRTVAQSARWWLRKRLGLL